MIDPGTRKECARMLGLTMDTRGDARIILVVAYCDRTMVSNHTVIAMPMIALLRECVIGA
jgi:hypothetical protein